MIKIAITGNIASGKSEADKIVAKHGYKLLCTDTTAHELFENDDDVKKETMALFNTLDRKKIGEIVFSDKHLKEELEKIIHPRIRKKIEEFFILNMCEKLVFVDVPLLYEAKFEDMFDRVILICADEKIRLQRLLKRNNYTKDHALRRINSQMPQDEKKVLADYVVKNEGTLEDLEVQMQEVIKALELLE